MIESITASWTK